MGKIRLILPRSVPGVGEPGLNSPQVLGLCLGDLTNKKW